MRPPGVSVSHGRYYLIRQNKWHPLTRVDQGEVALLEAFYRLTGETPLTMAGVLMAYLMDGTSDIRETTKAKYRQAIVTRLIPWCGHMPINTLTASHVAQYLEARRKAGASVAGNRERAALSSACNYGMRQGLLDVNPCHGVRRNKERPSRRYVEHAELVNVLDRAPPALYYLLSAAYLTGLRQSDLMALRKDHLTAEGIEVTESKTGKPRLVQWSPTLRQIINEAAVRSKRAEVFTTAKGLPWTVWGLQSAMRRLKPGFRFRDLRPKAETDAPGVLGHSGQMQERYRRRKAVRPVR